MDALVSMFTVLSLVALVALVTLAMRSWGFSLVTRRIGHMVVVVTEVVVRRLPASTREMSSISNDRNGTIKERTRERASKPPGISQESRRARGDLPRASILLGEVMPRKRS